MKVIRTGHTLVELMVVVALVAVIATIAITMYDNYTLKSRQEKARATVLDVAGAQERHFAARGGYAARMIDLVHFGLRGKQGTNGWEIEETTLYTGAIIDDRAGFSYWVAGNTDTDRNLAESLGDCWMYFGRNTPQPPFAQNGFNYLYDDKANAQRQIVSGVDINTYCKP